MLAILTTHPIQYQAPIWQALARRGNLDFEVWYLSDHGVRAASDPEFGQSFAWDLDLLGGYRYRFLPMRPAGLPIDALQRARIAGLATLLRTHEVSALWINGWQVLAYWQAAFIAHRLGIPVWLRGETNDLRRPRWLKRLPRALALRALFAQVSAFLFIGTANRRFYRSFGVPERKLFPAPYCVDNERFAAAAAALQPTRADLRARWGIPEPATCFLFSGKFVVKKRPLDLLNAVEQIVRQHPHLAHQRKIHLLLVGDGELRPALEARAKALEAIAGRPLVTFAGFLNQQAMPQAYVAADCLVLPSDAGETWGLVVNEALACGRPAIVSDRCGCAEDLALPLGAEHVFQCGSVSQLAHCMQWQIDHADPQREGRHARLLSSFSIAHTVSAVEQLWSREVLWPNQRGL